jgi:hypothetical protein
MVDYEEARRAFDAGEDKEYSTGKPAKDSHTFEDWHGEPPDPESYRQEYVGECIGWQMYEETSEGTPISPVMPDPEALANWLADNKASVFGGMTCSRDEWLRIIVGGGSFGVLIGPETGGQMVPHIPDEEPIPTE